MLYDVNNSHLLMCPMFSFTVKFSDVRNLANTTDRFKSFVSVLQLFDRRYSVFDRPCFRYGNETSASSNADVAMYAVVGKHATRKM